MTSAAATAHRDRRGQAFGIRGVIDIIRASRPENARKAGVADR
jgi:hypothetical protein